MLFTHLLMIARLSDQACPEFTEKKLRYLGFRKVDRLRLCLPIHPVYSDLFCERCLGLDRAENTEGTMIQHWTFARGGAWRNPKPTGGPYVCEQCRLDACGGNDGTLTLQAVTAIELAPTDVCADCGARLLEERVGHPSSIGRTHP